MSKGSAVLVLVRLARLKKLTRNGYSDATDALAELGITGDERGHVLYHLGYADTNGNLHRRVKAWLP